MYPLHMTLRWPEVGFALANDAKEHTELNAEGYLPMLQVIEVSHDDLIAQAEAKGIKVDKRWSDKRLAEELSK